MKEKIKQLIINFMKEYENNISTKWREPVIRFGDANHKDFITLKKSVNFDHVMPNEIIKDAKTIIAYFIPFNIDISKSNIDGNIASKEWALAYQETNELFTVLNEHIIKYLKSLGYDASTPSKEATAMDDNIIKSKWSQRHVARICGLGTFGINNMLITEKGCSGRVNTIITNIDNVEIDSPLKEEYCLYKINNSCKVCVNRCISKTLTIDGFDRKKCYDVCIENARIHNGNDVCGKCVVNLPCSFNIPKI